MRALAAQTGSKRVLGESLLRHWHAAQHVARLPGPNRANLPELSNRTNLRASCLGSMSIARVFGRAAIAVGPADIGRRLRHALDRIAFSWREWTDKEIAEPDVRIVVGEHNAAQAIRAETFAIGELAGCQPFVPGCTSHVGAHNQAAVDPVLDMIAMHQDPTAIELARGAQLVGLFGCIQIIQ